MHGLILSGGGALGAYEAAMAAAVVRHYAETDHPVRLVGGSSVGALNAAALAVGGPEHMLDLWRRIAERDVLRRGWFGTVGAALRIWRGRPAYDSEPLRRLIAREAPVEKLVLAPRLEWQFHATELVSRRQLTWNRESPWIAEGLLASASLPGLFPPVHIAGLGLVDGGVVANTPIGAAIRAGCDRLTIIYLDDELVRSPALVQDHLDHRPRGKKPDLAPYRDARAALSRSLEVMLAGHLSRDLALLEERQGLPGRRRVRYRLLQPQRPLAPTGGATLNFERAFLDGLLERGALDAALYLQLPWW